jgi:hypothetical protein
MNPIVLYPKNAEQAKFFKESAKSKDVEMLLLSKEFMNCLEKMDDLCFAEKLVERSENTKNVSRKKMMALFNSKLNK